MRSAGLALLVLGVLAPPAIAQIVVAPAPSAGALERYAAEELVRWLQPVTAQEVRLGPPAPPAEGYILVGVGFDHPAELGAQEIWLASSTHDGRPAVVVSGGDARGVLYAAYELLTQYGYRFEFSGEVAPPRIARLDLARVQARRAPAVAERGLRLHLNFPMDQSAYGLDEWRQWIDRVARLRFNYLSLHLYADQPWLPLTYRGVTATLGDFFVGRRSVGGRYRLLDGIPGRAQIRNRTWYYPPDLEDVIDPATRYDRARARMRAVIAHAHARGIRCAVAIEPLATPLEIRARLSEWSASVDDPDELVVDLARASLLALIDAYPEADEYQLMSVEGADDAPREAEAQRRIWGRLRARHGVAPLVDPTPDAHRAASVPAAPYGAAALAAGDPRLGALRFVDLARRVFDDAQVAARLRTDGKASSIGLYLPDPPTIATCLPAIVTMLSPGTRLHLLAGYGAREIADQLPDWAPLRGAPLELGLITWLEFDGSMFLPQLWWHALADTMRNLGGLPVSSLYANHWRVSGVEADAALLAHVAWYGEAGKAMEQHLGWLYGADAGAAQAAYDALEQVTLLARERLFNVGFCYEGYEGHRPYPTGDLAETRRAFGEAAASFARLAARQPRGAGRERAAYLANRCAAAVTHLDAIDAFARAFALRAAATEADVREARAQAERARALGLQYLRTYAQEIRDRGDQGLLVNYYYALVWRSEQLLAHLPRSTGAATPPP